MIAQAFDILIRNQVFGRAQADAIVAGGEVKEGTARRRRWHCHDAFADKIASSTQQRMNDHRRQREVINQVRFVLIAKVGQVFEQRQVGFGNEQHIRMHRITRQTHRLDQFVGLIKVDRGRADFLPDKADGIQPHHAHAVLEVVQNHSEHLKEYVRIAVIQIHLVIAKGAPDLLLTLLGHHVIEQRMTARADDIGKVIFKICGLDVINAGLFACQKLLIPRVGCRNMVCHQIGHHGCVL